MSGHRVETSRVVAVEPVVAFDRLMGARLPDVFARRYAALPAVKDVADEPDDWGIVGQTRTIVLADGGRLRETLTVVDRPDGFAYVLDEIEGPLRHFVHRINGGWTIAAEGDGARIGWAWTFYPKASPARLTTSVIGRMWKGYADRALIELETILVRDG
jgi:Polyketide cyclase / dehydrase and lipid transport